RLALELFLFALGRERTLAEIVDLIALLDAQVGQLGVDGGPDVAGQRPGRGRPHEQILARPLAEREADEDGAVGDVAVALVHFHLADADAAARAPRHGVEPAVNQVALVALLEERPDR